MKKIIPLLLFGLSFSVLSAVPKKQVEATSTLMESKVTQTLLSRFKTEYTTKEEITLLQQETLKHAGDAVPALIEVMKNAKYPDKNRWVATFLLGQIMGEKSAPFVAKFVEHPSWVLRMASLKTLLALRQDKYAPLFTQALQDDSLIVRTQALDNIRELNLKDQAPHVWAMLYDQKNYYQPKKDSKDKNETLHKRSHLIKRVITTIGDLKFEKARDPLFTMIQNERYNDIFDEMDYALSQIIGRASPEGTMQSKRHFWNRTALSFKTF
jgi:hypothetical protein